MTGTEPIVRRKRRIGFDKINRRTHLYSGLFFIPWFLFYALSSAVFNHPAWFGSGQPQMTPLFDRLYTDEPAIRQGDPRPFAERLLKANGLDGPFAVRWTDHDEKLIINQVRFLSNTQITFDPATRHVSATRGWANARILLIRVHTRGGYDTNGSLQIFWAALVDVIQLTMMTWIATGLYMWWNLKRFRGWGMLALGSGIALFAAFLFGL
ncbi:MAG TPA: hypothetical protein VHC90_04345 [Bryobacteraceae bacterium]|nr:hypothetical protein [Bryobacteraceae bacterium]